MKPIDYDGNPLPEDDPPFTVTLHSSATVKDLLNVLADLIGYGLGNEKVCLGSDNGDIDRVRTLEYYDTSDEYERGAASSPRTLLICC